jgi:enoyl-CoA hydratase/carnithine racemase
MSFVLHEPRESIGVVTLNRPERLNAISGDLLAAFAVALDQSLADQQTAVVVLTGAGRAFCAGDDLKEFDRQSASEAATRAHIAAIQNITRIMMGSDKPIVGAVHGYAVGGGFEWLLNCDLVVAADDLVAFFPEMDWGQFVTGGVTYLLPLAVGHQRAMELLILGERQSAERLAQLGLVNWVVPRAELEAKAMEIAARVAEKSRFSVGRLKQLINRDLWTQLWRAVELEEDATVEVFRRPEVAARVARFENRKRGG